MIHDICGDHNVGKLIAVLDELKENDNLERFINQRDDKKYCPLHVAIFARNLPGVVVLLDYGADSNAKCHGTPPLLLALRTASQPNSKEFGISCFSTLLKQDGLLVNRKDDEGLSPIHLAARYNFVEVLDELDSLCDLSTMLSSAVKGTGLTPVHLAAYYNSLEALQWLHAHGASLTPTLAACGSTPLHIATSRRAWRVYDWLLALDDMADVTDKFGHKAAELLPPPQVYATLRATANCHNQHVTAPKTAIVTNEVCLSHHTCPPSELESSPPPENLHRLEVLIHEEDGILQSDPLRQSLAWQWDCRSAVIADIVRVHEYSYVKRIQTVCQALSDDPESPQGLGNLDSDTTVSSLSYAAAVAAAGAVCQAIDCVISKQVTNAFCPVRPPGHHAGVLGIPQDPSTSQSHGFCLLNNVSIGAGYALNRHRDVVKKIVIVDFDVHHGNGTEETVRCLQPYPVTFKSSNPMNTTVQSMELYKPWYSEHDTENVLFISVHGYGPSSKKHAAYWPQSAFYPGTGPTKQNDHEATTSGGGGGENILDIGVPLPTDEEEELLEDGTMTGKVLAETMYRYQWRNYFRDVLFPRITSFAPDLILISAGFDAHKKDTINAGYIALVEEDYTWITKKLVSIAHTYCEGRIVSVLEGGYQLGGEYTSAFAKSVYAHVEALVQGNVTSGVPKFSASVTALEKVAEEEILADLETTRQRELRKKEIQAMKQQQEYEALQEQVLREREQREQLLSSAGSSSCTNASQTSSSESNPLSNHSEESNDNGGRKRKRTQVDYVELAKQMDSQQVHSDELHHGEQ